MTKRKKAKFKVGDKVLVEATIKQFVVHRQGVVIDVTGGNHFLTLITSRLRPLTRKEAGR